MNETEKGRLAARVDLRDLPSDHLCTEMCRRLDAVKRADPGAAAEVDEIIRLIEGGMVRYRQLCW
jgi:hypothetical protein